jgi:hypothetical protein
MRQVAAARLASIRTEGSPPPRSREAQTAEEAGQGEQEHPAGREQEGSRAGERGADPGSGEQAGLDLDEGITGEGDGKTAEDRAGEDGDEGAGFHQAVAADQLVLRDQLRDNAVLDRAEEGGLSPHQEDDREQRGMLCDKARDGSAHDEDLRELDQRIR